MGEVFYRDEAIELYLGDAAQVVAELPDGSVDCVVTSPPYWGKRDYGVEGQYGQEPTPEAYIHNLSWCSGRCGGCWRMRGRCG
jgi:DNA modification methylase